MSRNGHEPSAEDIRADIERTRERLGDTVEALGAHLNPSLLKARVKDSVHEATIGRAKTMARNVKDKAQESGRGLIETIRENPIPVAMIAGGLGWLLFSKRREAGTVEALGAPEAETADDSRQLPEIGDDGNGLASKVKSAGDRVADGARVAGEKVVSTSSNLAHTVADRARSGARHVEDTYESNPMVLGAVAAAVGLAVGMTLPVSAKEAELMGGKRDELVDKAREAISETKEKVRSAAERAVPEVGATLKEVAREEGLPGA